MLDKTIVPTIFAKNKDVFLEKLEMLEFAPTIHLDFMDGQFTKNGKSITLDVMKDLIPKDDPREYQVHLMAFSPEKYIKNLLKVPQIYRVYVQYESYDDEVHMKMSINEFKSRNYEVFLVLNPETDINVINGISEQIDGIMFMSVVPGAEGQGFIVETLDKIKKTREKLPNMEICVDGGVNEETISDAKNAGINTFCVGSAISSTDAPKESYEKLKVLVNN